MRQLKLSRNSGRVLLRYRGLILVVVLAITGFFAFQLRHLDIATRFGDLLPHGHPYIELFKKYPDFGSPLTIYTVVEVKEGDIFNPLTLAKIKRITEALDAIPGVNHNMVASLASRKLKKIEAVQDGVQSSYLMAETPPATPEEIATFRYRAMTAPGVLGAYVSLDGKATLITATFIDHLIDYEAIFRAVRHLRAVESDANHVIHTAGQPMLTGWVYHYRGQLYRNFALTIAGMVLLLLLLMRTISGTLTPIFVTLLTAVWGFGLVAVTRSNLDPLIMVIPILLIARSLSHAVQAVERYNEMYVETGDALEAAAESFRSIFPPGVLAIITDAAALFAIVVAPIPLMQKLGIFAGMWALCIIPGNVIVTPIILSYLPAPRLRHFRASKAAAIPRLLDSILWGINALTGRPRARRFTVALFVLVVLLSLFFARGLQIGDARPGTSILWPNSSYNVAVATINQKFAGMDVLQVVVEAQPGKSIKTREALAATRDFQRFIEQDPNVKATFSFADFVPVVRRIFNGGNPVWEVVPPTDLEAGFFAQMATAGANPGDYDSLFTPKWEAANISVWYPDHRQGTIKAALQRARDFIDSANDDLDDVRFAMASGVMGIQAAVNDIIVGRESLILFIVLAVVFLSCSILYRSWVAGIMLLIPVNIANLFASATMALLGIGLDINTLPIAGVGIGVGIDYGIYLLSRIYEEAPIHPRLERAVPRAVQTTGRAIFFTASTILISLVPWYFLADLRFQADMGLLLALLMFFNMIVALVTIPLLVYIFKPAFLRRRLGQVARAPREIAEAVTAP